MVTMRSSVSRILYASAASWVRIGVTVVTQMALVPLYLASWDAKIFGAWLLLQAVWSVVAVVDVAHHEYVGYECLRLGTTRRVAITGVISAAMPMALVIALWDVLLVFGLGKTDLIASWVGHDPVLLGEWRAALLVQAVTWLITGSLGGLAVRWLTPFGYWPQFAWWGVLNAVVIAVAPAVAVVVGANILQAMWVLCAANVIYYLIFFAAMARMMRHEGLRVDRPRLVQGLSQGMRALWLCAKSFGDMARQQGSRIMLAPLAGVASMAAFSTMRTGANFALQGLNTVTGPLMPELMRFLSARDQPRMESAFAVVWLVLCVVLCPGMLIVQYLAPALFPLWTHGKIAFDPWLFGMLSQSVAVMALAQPAAAVLQGNNVLRAQLVISLLAALVAVGGIALLVPQMGIRGAALALLVAEGVSLFCTVWVAGRWLQANGMYWPWRPFAAAAGSLLVTAIGLTALVLLPTHFTWVGLAIGLLLQAVVGFIYFQHLPLLARSRAVALLLRFMPSFLRRASIPLQASTQPSDVSR